MLARVLPVLAAALVVSALVGCTGESPDTTDVDRIAVMRADAVYRHLVGDPDASEGREEDGAFLATTFAAPVDPWAGQNPPVGPTVAQRKAAIARLVEQLRTSGWFIISARCENGADAAGTDSDASDDSGDRSYLWEVFGYRIIDEVPYVVRLSASFTGSSGFSVRVSMATPFHGDPAHYFVNPPPGLAESTTCVEIHSDSSAGSAQGTIWSLDGARG